MAKHIVKCLQCGQQFDANIEDFVVEGKRYLHKECYKKWEEDKFYKDDLHDYIKHIFGASYSKMKIDRQIKELLEDGKEMKWINKAIKYWYSIKKEDPTKSQGGIRIINYIYDEAIDYYKRQEKYQTINKGTNIKEILAEPPQEIKIRPKPIQKPKRIKLFDLQ